jgi:hypothetical protein
MRFTNWEIMCRHYMTHAGEKPYEFGVCRQRFSPFDTLQHYQKIQGTKVSLIVESKITISDNSRWDRGMRTNFKFRVK